MADSEVGFYDPIGVTKSRVCTLLARSQAVRDALDYKCEDGQYKDEYDPDNPLTLIWNCIIPVLKDPDTITTADPQILVGIESQADFADPRLSNIFGTIVIIVDNSDLRTNVRYIREDLIEHGGVCAYTKADLIAHAVRQALASQESITWVGDIVFLESSEGATNNTTHYSRVIKFRIKEVNLENRGV